MAQGGCCDFPINSAPARMRNLFGTCSFFWRIASGQSDRCFAGPQSRWRWRRMGRCTCRTAMAPFCAPPSPVQTTCRFDNRHSRIVYSSEGPSDRTNGGRPRRCMCISHCISQVDSLAAREVQRLLDHRSAIQGMPEGLHMERDPQGRRRRRRGGPGAAAGQCSRGVSGRGTASRRTFRCQRESLRVPAPCGAAPFHYRVPCPGTSCAKLLSCGVNRVADDPQCPFSKCLIHCRDHLKGSA